MRTIEQRRAENALKRVTDMAATRKDEFKKLYRSYADSLGPAILMNGLGQALATEKAAAGNDSSSDRGRAHDELYKSVELWLCRSDEGVYASESDLLKAITENDETLYLRAQAETLAWLEWHKKFCRAYFPADDGGNG